MAIILVVAVAFGLCFLVDKGFTKVFRNKAQHHSGLSVRLNKRFATGGILLLVLGIAGLMASIENGVPMLVGSLILLLVGIGLLVYYLSFGIYYDEDSLLVTGFAKKSVVYRYDQIQHQLLYTLQGGGLIVELYMNDGSTVQVLSGMPGYDKFLDHAFSCWCRQRGLNPENCAFHDPKNSIWFPNKEV